MRQVWRDLLFLHWRWDAGLIAARVPSSLSVDVYDGSAWVGIVPFRMEGIRFGRLPAFPGARAFPELNLRTYVRDELGRRGVWFFSLDAANRPAVWIARGFFHLNYRFARMSVTADEDGRVAYRSQRPGDTFQDFQWKKPLGELEKTQGGSLEEFLIERYRLFAASERKRKIFTGMVAHQPYEFARVSVESYSPRLFALNGFEEPPNPPDSVIAAPGFQVDIFPMEEANAIPSRPTG